MANNYFATYAQDLEQDPFDPEDFVERLAWRLTGGPTGPEAAIDPNELHRAFEEEISNLQLLSDQYQGKIQRLQNQCREEEEEFFTTLERLQDENTHCFDKLKDLDGQINTVAAKVVHLGDQLQSVNAPRSRAFEALQLMEHFNEFLSDQPLESDIFTDPDRLLESAEIIHKLSLISQELDSGKYSQVQTRIAYKYDEIERLMIEEFVRSHRLGNKGKMKHIADILSQFKGAFRSADIFGDILELCEKTNPILEEIFPSPEQVMAKMVLNIFHGKLQEYLKSKLGDADDPESYLSNLYDLYSKTRKLSGDLTSRMKVGSDKEYVTALIRALFAKYINPYMSVERKHLKDVCTNLLAKFYDSKGHQKKAIQGGGGLSDLKRDIQARILNPETYGGESFLSEEVAINILQETKQAFQRCSLLSAPGETATNVEAILDLLLKYLCLEHLDYAVELGLHGIPLSEPKAPPSCQFFLVVRQVAAICHLFEKQFEDSLIPLVKKTPQVESCMGKKRMALYALENKMSNGLDRLLNAIMGYVKFILGEQKKTDFRPEQDDSVIPLCSNASITVGKFLSEQMDKVKESLDGENLTSFHQESGIRFHRTILDHLYQFQYTSAGAMLLLCDINEYRKCVSGWKIPLVNKLFETLHALCNLLVVVPENLSDACTAELLGDVDRSIISNFVQLRADYKAAKLFNEFR